MKQEKKYTKLIHGIKLIGKGYKLLSSIDKPFVILQCIHAAIYSAIPIAGIYGTSKILNELSLRKRPQALAGYAVMLLLTELFLGFIKELLSLKINLHFQLWDAKIDILFSKVHNEMQLTQLEDPKVKIKKNQIKTNQNATGAGLTMLVYQLEAAASSLFTILFSAALTAGIFIKSKSTGLGFLPAFFNSRQADILLVLMILFCMFFILKTGRTETRKICKEWESLPESNRILLYYQNSIKDNLGAMDIRIYNQSPIIMEEIDKWTNNPEYIKRISKIKAYYGKINTLLKTIIHAAIFLYIGIKVYLKVFLVGSFIQYTGAVSQFVFGVSSLFQSISILFTNNQYLKEILDYLDLPKEQDLGRLPISEEEQAASVLEFQNISFCYPRSSTPALNDVSVKIKKNKKIAIVGENGSGKTTFIKLLCGLYPPSKGQILLNGTDASVYQKEAYGKLFSVVFQDFNLFSLPLGQNIASDIAFDQDRAETCMKQAGFYERFINMKDGLQTNLYKEFDVNGIEISGGEAQKIAIARALYKDAPYFILDEPTAALDPVSEYEIYQHIHSIQKDKTVIFISHRLSSCCFCDEILVFDKGQIVQKGSHTELLADMHGKYYSLWNAQAQYYQEDAS